MPGLQVAIQDDNGNTVTGSAASITIAIANNPASGTLTGTTTVAAVNGVATFADLSINKSGSGYAFTASSSGLTSATSSSFAVTAGPPAAQQFTTQPSNGVAGVAANPVITVTVRDALDNPVSNVAVTLAITSATAFGGAVLAGGTTATTANGVATFTNVFIERAGTAYTLQATTSGAPTVVSSAFDITHAAPAKLVFAESPGIQDAMDILAPAPRVSIQDAFSNIATSATTAVTLLPSLSSSPFTTAAITLLGTTTVNAVNGYATFNGLRVDRPVKNLLLRATSSLLTTGLSSTFAAEMKFDTVSAGGTATGSHTCSLGANKFAFCWGANQFGQLGDNTTTERVAPAVVTGGLTFSTIGTGSNHNCALTPLGAAYCWGSNAFGQLGDGTVTQRTSPVAVSGALVFESIEAGDGHTCAVVKGTNGGPAYCWGRNDYGQLGDGTTMERHLPTAVAGGLTVKSLSADSSHTCAVVILNGQEGFCWGNNSNGQLGDGTTTQRLSPQKIVGDRQWSFIVTGALHSCGSVSGGLYCWGSNSNGQMGNGNAGTTTSTPTLLTGFDGFWLSAGWWYNCSSGTVQGASTTQLYCWGHNGNGQIGDGTTTDRNTFVQVGVNLFRVDASRYHTCGTNASKEALCWGSNANGQLGDGTRVDRHTPTKVTW